LTIRLPICWVFTVVLGKEKYITAEILADCGSNFESG
jgi:hypothetical protein